MSDMSGPLTPTSDTCEFNQYDTEIVKLDGNNWDEHTNQVHPDEPPFALLAEEDQLLDFQMSPDSINNKSFTDVTFIVGPSQHTKKYVAHRVLLAMTSPVFETMFYGDMADKSKYIRVPDVAPIGFENLLRFAYTDSLKLASVDDAMLTAYAAKKYLLPQLLRECLLYIEHNISPASACVVFEFAQVLNSHQLALQAINLIDRQTDNVIGSKSFSHVQPATVEFVANRRYLNVTSEYDLFVALLAWTLSEARRRHLDGGDWSSVRSVMSENCTLSAVRFLAMTNEEFARVVARTSSKLEVSKVEEKQANGTDELAGSDRQQPSEQVDVDDSNCLLTDAEQRAIFLNLSLANSAKLPPTINPSTGARQSPPEHFSVRRFRSSANNLVTTTTSTRSIKSVGSKFQCLSENVFIVALTIPIRLDVSAYANRTPKFECHLKFSAKPASVQPGASAAAAAADSSAQSPNPETDESTLLMDTIDESLHISIARDKDCLVRLKRPILVRMANVNELTLTFQSYALDEDIVALRTPKSRSANFSELTDSENISWLFFKVAHQEFSEIHYYY